jgi:hypothetical protein
MRRAVTIAAALFAVVGAGARRKLGVGASRRRAYKIQASRRRRAAHSR